MLFGYDIFELDLAYIKTSKRLCHTPSRVLWFVISSTNYRLKFNWLKKLFSVRCVYCLLLYFPSSVDFYPFSSADQNKLFANSVEPDETAHNEHSSGSTQFAILFWFLTETPICNNDVSKVRDGSVHFRNSGVKRLMWGRISVSRLWESLVFMPHH